MTYQYLLNKYGVALTFEQAAKELNLHWQTVRQMCLRGEIKAVRSGRKWILTTKALSDYIEGNSESSKPSEIVQMPTTGKGFKKIV